MAFQYLQLRHAFRAQFPQPPGLQADQIEGLLTLIDLEKTLFTLYGALLTADSPKLEKLFEYWQKDIPSLDREDWEDCLKQGPKPLISYKDKLIQDKIPTPGILHSS